MSETSVGDRVESVFLVFVFICALVKYVIMGFQCTSQVLCISESLMVGVEEIATEDSTMLLPCEDVVSQVEEGEHRTDHRGREHQKGGRLNVRLWSTRLTWSVKLLQPHYNAVEFGYNAVEFLFPLPIIPVYETLIITLFCYNTDLLWTKKSVLFGTKAEINYCWRGFQILASLP